jgi:hypothetical protein
MEGKEVQSKLRYLLALLIGTSIFLSVILLSNVFGKVELNRIDSINGEMAQDIFKDKLIYSFFEEGICSEDTYNKISMDLRSSGTIINDLEIKFGKNDPDVLEQKKFYTLMLLEHLEFLINYNSNCDTSLPYILFFYSNQKDKLETSQNVGKTLDIVSKEHPKLLIYSFDINLESELIKRLLTKYSITQAPTLVINGKTTLENSQNINEIEKYLEQ